MEPPLLQIENLRIGFRQAQGDRPAVGGLSLSIRKGETLALLGESGSGKSLTALAIMQLLPPAAKIDGSSKILLRQEDLLALPEVKMRKIRGARIAMIFQEPMTSLNPVLTVGEQIYESLKIHAKLRGAAAQEKIIELFDAVGLPEPARQLARYPHQLSGGMKQRVMIAMALAGKPDLLIADEPTSALDVTTQKQILDLLKALQQETGMALLLITHDLGVVKQVADTVAVMYTGQIVELAAAATFFRQPLHPYSRQLFASLPDIRKRHQTLAVIPGTVPVLSADFSGCCFASRCVFKWEPCVAQTPRWLEAQSQHYARCHQYDAAVSQPVREGKRDAAAVMEAPANALPPQEKVLEIRDIKVYFPVRKGFFKRTMRFIKAVDGVSLHLDKGRTLAIVGESGCGKTTLARSILQLIPSSGGVITFHGMRQQNTRSLRRFAQIIFQDPFSSLNPRMLVGDIISEGMRALRLGDKNHQRTKVNELLEAVGLPADSIDRYPHEFSGGQRQRICIARALAVQAELLICDEPTSALDVSVQAQILNLLKKLQREQSLSYLFITHNIAVVAYMADEIAVMHQGKIVEYGEAIQVLTRPAHSYTRKLLSAVPYVFK